MSYQALTWAVAQRTGKPGRKAVLMALANMSDQDYSCWPSQAYIAEVTELSERAVRNYLGDLTAAGLLQRTRRSTPDGRKSDRYTLPVRVLVDVSNRHVVPVATPNRHAVPVAQPARGAGSETLPAPENKQPARGATGTACQGITIKREEPSSSPRDDVERLCEHLARRLVDNGCKAPTIGKAWRDAARLLMDRDGRTEEQIHRAIDWCQDDEFWHTVILSMPKLRQQYEQMRLKAAVEAAKRGEVAPSTAKVLGKQWADMTEDERDAFRSQRKVAQ